MPKFLVEASYTAEGAQGILKNGGTARRKAAQDAVAQFGGTVEAFYFAFGSEDAFIIVDIPDAESMAAISLAVSASGTIRTKAKLLLSPEQVDEAAAKHAKFRAPGQ